MAKNPTDLEILEARLDQVEDDLEVAYDRYRGLEARIEQLNDERSRVAQMIRDANG